MITSRPETQFPNPKVTAKTAGTNTWYRYYAGYASEFVEYSLATVAPGAKRVLDPWNGTGTTTVVAANLNRHAYGYDINPVAVVIARARLLGSSTQGSIQALAADIIEHAAPVRIAGDPLFHWFSPDTAAQLRALELSTHRLLVDSAAPPLGRQRRTDTLSGLAAFFYTALFRTTRTLAQPAGGTNPTWWKRREGSDVLRVPKRAINEVFRSIATELGAGLHRMRLDLSTSTTISVGDSRSLPLPAASIDAVVSSPPYCTRMDYGVATRPELAILGYSETALDELRASMVGTPTITGEDTDDHLLGAAASRFLRKVKQHPSQASSGYYSKFFRQYYTAMRASLTEIRRVTSAGAPVMLVIQDGYYKDVHNDVPGIVADMALGCGFSSFSRQDFHVPRTIAGMNAHARKYRVGSAATESVLTLQ